MSNAAEDLRRIGAMAQVLMKLQTDVELAEAALTTAKGNLQRMEKEDFPELLREVGLKEVKLEDGTKIKLVDEIQCGITEAHKPAAYKWLRDNNFDGMIKTTLTVPFGKGEDEALQEVREALATCDITPVVAESIHHATLKSFIKEQRAKGVNVPVQPFGIFPYSKAVVTQPK